MIKLRKIGKNRKGEGLVDDVLSVAVIVIAFVLLIFVVVQGIKALTGQEKKNVKNTLEIISERLQAIDTNGEYSYILQGFKGANNWFLAGWNLGESGRPDKCYFESCLCICGVGADGKNAGEKCQSNGYCKTLKYDFVSVEDINGNIKDKDKFVLPTNSVSYNVSVKNENNLKYASVKLDFAESLKPTSEPLTADSNGQVNYKREIGGGI